ncbi:rhomboid family intramembrane serine protease [Neorhodopirellula lusitana]|uniref:rhomboid family intramembrane serine protease n=1 Tax=Neorhodopirellula lusitana TaxID=445327 RepID=UPI00384E7527
MRRIGTLADEATSNRFCDYLQTQSIDAKAEPSHDSDSSGGASATPHDIWIRAEQDVPQAREFLAAFQAAPQAKQYDVSAEAERLRKAKANENAKKLKLQKKVKMRGGSALGGAGNSGAPIPVTITVIVIATLVGFFTQFGQLQLPRPGEAMSTELQVFYGLSVIDDYTYHETGDAFALMKQGQIWRLVTPMFLHGSTWHLAFNMINLFVLGSVVERIHGSVFFAILLLLCQAAATLTQILMPDWLEPPLAIGASGAVFGVFGFLWIRPKLDPNYPVEIPPINVMFMLIFLFICMTPIIDGIANGAHVGGLLAGMVITVVTPKL